MPSLILKVIQPTKRVLGWVVQTPTQGNILVVRRTPRAINVTTKRTEYNSINQSIDAAQAGWTLDFSLIKAIKDFTCQLVAVYVPKTGCVYMTSAWHYTKPGVYYSVDKNKSGDKIRCVGMGLFSRHLYRPKL